MCGIVGIIGNIPPSSQVEKARDQLAHRGPDDEGLYYNVEQGVALGQRRLSIIDLSSDGHQPFIDPTGRFILVFNGEIYNYVELKEELKSNFSFRTKTDTEVILAAYIKWGSNCVQKFNGMFAFALYDTKEQTLFCARDRVGIKPFFYVKNDRFFAFASEIKALFSFGVVPRPNDSIIFDYLFHGLYDHREETFFADIFSLPAGSTLTVKDGQIEQKKYWDLAHVTPTTLADSDIREQFEWLIADAVRLQFRSDVPVGINLSSGLDSNSLLYFGRKAVGDNIHTFSICLEDNDYNECELISQHADFGNKNLWHPSFFLPENLLTQAQNMVRIQDQPYGGIPTIIYTAINAEAKKQGVTVLLEGQGIDEMLAGYNYYQQELDRDEGKVHEGSLGLSQDGSRLATQSLLSAEFLQKNKESSLQFIAPFSSHLLNAQYRDFVHTKLPRVLRFNDHVSMAYGRELRVPFLDHRIAEFCFSLPARFKINSTTQKVLMRETMRDRVPAGLLELPKKAFGAVQNLWLKKYLEPQIIELLSSSSFMNRGYWNYDVLNNKVKSFFAGKEDNSFFLWQCINLELWFREFIQT